MPVLSPQLDWELQYVLHIVKNNKALQADRFRFIT